MLRKQRSGLAVDIFLVWPQVEIYRGSNSMFQANVPILAEMISEVRIVDHVDHLAVRFFREHDLVPLRKAHHSGCHVERAAGHVVAIVNILVEDGPALCYPDPDIEIWMAVAPALG